MRRRRPEAAQMLWPGTVFPPVLEECFEFLLCFWEALGLQILLPRRVSGSGRHPFPVTNNKSNSCQCPVVYLLKNVLGLDPIIWCDRDRGRTQQQLGLHLLPVLHSVATGWLGARDLLSVVCHWEWLGFHQGSSEDAGGLRRSTSGTPQTPKAEGWSQKGAQLSACPHQAFSTIRCISFSLPPNQLIPNFKLTDASKPSPFPSVFSSHILLVSVGMAFMLNLWWWWEK